MKSHRRQAKTLGFALSLALASIACGPPSPAKRPLPPESAEAIQNAGAIPDVVVLEYKADGTPTNYLLPTDDALAVASGGKSLIVGARFPDGAAPQKFDVAVLRMNAWNHEQQSMMGESANQDFRIPVFDAPDDIRQVIQSLRVGEKARIWVADKEQDGATAVMDMELIEVVSPPEAPIDLVAAPPGATVLEKGLTIRTLEEAAKVDQPEPQDIVTIEYTSWDPSGEVLDASIWNPAPTKVELKSVPAGIKEAILTMSVGQKIRMWVPKDMHDAKSAIVTDMHLVSITHRPAPIPAPADVAAAPKRARKTKSGLRYQILERKAVSRKKPKATETVEVHYTGWTTDGEMFDSSVTRGVSSKFPLNRVVPGWSEGLQLMRPGQRFRFWIPAELAYKGSEGKPQGMLVFDVELLSIVDDQGTP